MGVLEKTKAGILQTFYVIACNNPVLLSDFTTTVLEPRTRFVSGKPANQINFQISHFLLPKQRKAVDE